MQKSSKKSANKKSKTAKSLIPKYIEMKGFLSFFILHELDARDMSGDELAAIIGERKGSTLTPGTIYPALKRLRRQKLIKYTRNGRKKLYYLTYKGKFELNALYNTFKAMFLGFKGRLKR